MSKKKQGAVAAPDNSKLVALYDIIRSPIITEKATFISQFRQFTFHVPIDSTKKLVREAVEAVFKVKVLAVNTLRQKGKTKVFRGRRGMRSDYKKAIVTLAEGQTIDVNTGVS